MNDFYRFELERMQSTFENVVEFDLSESGVLPVILEELLADAPALAELGSTRLAYAQTNGTPELRERVSALYPGATADNVLITVGAAEANYLSMHTVVSPGDEVVVMLPNYMQIWGIAHNRGMVARAFHLQPREGWAPDIDELERTVGASTRLIAVCNPNNPTGYILSAAEMDAVVAVAERVGAWILADEVYTGTEIDREEETPSFFGRYDKVLATNSLSKAYGLPGLRIGWVVGPRETVAALWERHDYTTIGTTMLGNRLAALALEPANRSRLVARARELVRSGLPVLEAWLEDHEGVFEMVPPRASPIALARYDLPLDSVSLVKRMIDEKSVLVVPGAHFGLEGYLRFRHGLPPDYLARGLERIGALIGEIQSG